MKALTKIGACMAVATSRVTNLEAFESWKTTYEEHDPEVNLEATLTAETGEYEKTSEDNFQALLQDWVCERSRQRWTYLVERVRWV